MTPLAVSLPRSLTTGEHRTAARAVATNVQCISSSAAARDIALKWWRKAAHEWNPADYRLYKLAAIAYEARADELERTP